MEKKIIATVVAFLVAVNLGFGQWKTYSVQSNNNFLGIAQNNSGVRVIVDGSGWVRMSSDGGGTWTKSDSVAKSGLYGATVVGDSTVWVVGRYGGIYTTKNLGQNWVRKDVSSSGTLNKVAFYNKLAGAVVGNDGLFAYTGDGGDNWEKKSISLRTGNFKDVILLSDSVILVVGLDGMISKTMDAGDTWTTSLNVDYGLNGVFFDGALGWACGYYGTVFRTDNNGDNWQRVSRDSSYHLNSIDFWNSSEGWAVGDKGVVLRTLDSGKTWKMVKQELTSNDLYAVRSISQSKIWVVGYEGTAMEYDKRVSAPRSLIADNKNVLVYPNPLVNQARIKFAGDVSQFDIHLRDLTGVDLGSDWFRTAPSNGEILFERGDLISGIYFIDVSTPEWSSTIKIIVVD